ncbi:MinD/ParA family protein [Actinomadura syzygii]|uniref:MinD/ParA family ATP-binding protein n=1 Tax=Actinomadura syzygii TaxID=1427538 RepID=UPI001651F13D|nr:MinD/ParA family protein [Actinomadura syzygii]
MGSSVANQAQHSADLAAALGRPVPSCRRIAVTSIRGGAGKSTVTALVADAIRAYRQDRTIAIDADPGLGSLPMRLGVTSTRSVRDLAAARSRSWEEMSAFLARTPQGLWALSGTSGGQVGEELDYTVFDRGVGRLSRYFAASVVDCGAGLVSGLQRSILRSAHAQVFVAPGTSDGALSARSALDWFVENGLESLLMRTVIVLVAHTPHPDTDLERARQWLAAGGLRVEIMPYDRHLATGAVIDADRIGGASRTVALQVAAQVFAHSLTWTRT